MAYNDQISKEQGAFKISEAFTDHELDIIKTEIGESGIEVIERMIRIQGDSFRKSSYILHSDGRINWTGSQLQFDSDARANDIIFRLLQTEDVGGSANPRTIDLKMIGDQTTNGEQIFSTIDMANGDLLYLELDRDKVFAAVSGAGEVNYLELHNAVGGLSTFAGATVKIINLSETSGMPELEMDSTGFNGSFCIPLAMRVDWSDGIDTYQDIWWIPHGIRWPANVRSTLGAVIVQGFETLPSVFVRNITEFNQAIADLTSTGGIICLQNNITIDSQITVPADVQIFGRSASGLGSNPANIVMVTGGQLQMGDRSRLWDVFIVANSLYGTSGTAEDNTLVKVVGEAVSIEKCWFQLNNLSGVARCIDFEGSDGRAIQCTFENSFAGNVAIYFSTGGSGNIYRDIINTLWVAGNTDEHQTSTDNFHSGGYTEEEVYKLKGAIPPVGSIIAINQGYYTTNNNTLWKPINLGYRGGSNLTNGNWKFCDGSALNDPQSPIWVGANRYLPKLTDSRFLMGRSASSGDGASSAGGSNSHSHTLSGSNTVPSVSLTTSATIAAFINASYNEYTNLQHRHGAGELVADIAHYSSSQVIYRRLTNSFTGNYLFGGMTGESSGSWGSNYSTGVAGWTGNAVTGSFAATWNVNWAFLNSRQNSHSHTAHHSHSNGTISGTAVSVANNNLPLYLSCWYYIRVK